MELGILLQYMCGMQGEYSRVASICVDCIVMLETRVQN